MQTESQGISQLVARAKTGETAAFNALVELNSGKMFAAAFRILQHKEQAEDCVQEAFIKMVTKISGFNEQSKFSTWLYSITVNTALDMLRKNAKHSHPEQTDFDQIESGEGNRSEDAVWLSDVGEATTSALNHLSDDVRVAFLLRHHQECSIAEICEILNINPSTAKSRIFRAVGRLRELLQSRVGDYETVD